MASPLSRYATYEILAQRAIKLLMQKLKEDFGTKVVVGAELEFGVFPNVAKNSILGALDFELSENNGKRDYRSFRDKVLHPSHSFHTSPYASLLIEDQTGAEQGLEIITSHVSKHANPLRVSSYLERFKRRLVEESNFSGATQIELGPFPTTATRSTEFNISLQNLDGSPHQFDPGRFIARSTTVLLDMLYVGVNTPQAAHRLIKKHSLNEKNNTLKSWHLVTPHHNFFEFDFLAPNSNSFLGMALMLTAIYHALDETNQSSHRLTIPAECIPEQGGDTSNFLRFLKANLEHSSIFKNTLNKLSGDEQLGSSLIEEIIKSPNLCTPVDDRTVFMR